MSNRIETLRLYFVKKKDWHVAVLTLIVPERHLEIKNVKLSSLSSLQQVLVAWLKVFQLVCCSQRVNPTWQYAKSRILFKFLKTGERSDACNGETLLAPCTRKKRLKRKMTKNYYYWIGAQDNIGMFSKSWSDCNNSLIN